MNIEGMSTQSDSEGQVSYMTIDDVQASITSMNNVRQDDSISQVPSNTSSLASSAARVSAYFQRVSLFLRQI